MHIGVDGDGSCLVHAVSRCLTGQEILYHALRTDVVHRLKADREKYLKLARDQGAKDTEFLEELLTELENDADPNKEDYQKADAYMQPGHVQVLADVLLRPILFVSGGYARKSTRARARTHTHAHAHAQGRGFWLVVVCAAASHAG